MTLRKNSPRAKRRWLALGSAVAALTLLVVGIALAVHDLDFQLDGNVVTSPDSSIGGNTQEIDWEDLFDANGAELALPAKFTASGFDRDFVTNPNGTFNTSDNTTYATGSKDTLPIDPGWQCNVDNNVLSKNDIMNSYAASYETGGAASEEILYFALERNANTGTANVGFWFLQDESVDCSSPGGSTAWTGDHTNGDLLVVSEFTQGGVINSLRVYEWVGGPNGALNPNPVAGGAGLGVQCSTAAGNDTVCGQVNTGTISTPWLTANKQDGVGHSLRVSEFFEAGLNLTDSGLGGRCFNVFIADTRSSTSLTATIFDFSRGSLGQCTSTTATTPSISSAAIPADPADASVSVTDSAAITVTGVSDWSGAVNFHLCGPTDPTLPIAGALCTTGGVDIGSTTASDETPTVNSPAAIVTAAGRYCFRANFAGDAAVGIPPSSDSRATECFVITPRQPTLSTQAGAAVVDFGQPVTDTATLGNTAHQPGTGGPTGSTLAGSINPTALGGDADGLLTFTLYKADCTTLATGTGTNPQTRTVSGNGNYGPVSFTPNAPGIYHWVASYEGDLPNTLSATHNAACSDTNERVEVRQIPTEIKTQQSWIPNDTATISATTGNLAAGGTVVFSLYPNAGCTGAAVYTQSFTPTGGAPTETFNTTNTGTGAGMYKITSAYADAADTVTAVHSWKVVYTPAAADTAHTGKQSSCSDEHFTIKYTNDPGPGDNLP